MSLSRGDDRGDRRHGSRREDSRRDDSRRDDSGDIDEAGRILFHGLN